jgi:hypothetical protein
MILTIDDPRVVAFPHCFSPLADRVDAVPHARASITLPSAAFWV